MGKWHSRCRFSTSSCGVRYRNSTSVDSPAHAQFHAGALTAGMAVALTRRFNPISVDRLTRFPRLDDKNRRQSCHSDKFVTRKISRKTAERARPAELENELVELASERAALTVFDRECISIIRRAYGSECARIAQNTGKKLHGAWHWFEPVPVRGRCRIADCGLVRAP